MKQKRRGSNVRKEMKILRNRGLNKNTKKSSHSLPDYLKKDISFKRIKGLMGISCVKNKDGNKENNKNKSKSISYKVLTGHKVGNNPKLNKKKYQRGLKEVNTSKVTSEI